MIGRLVRCYPILRQQLKSIQMDQTELARSINRSRRYVVNRMTGRGSFTLDEARAIMAATGLTGRTIDEVFAD